MKLTNSLLAVIIILMALSQPSFGDGILRIPSESGADSIMYLKSVDVQVEIYDQVAITTVRNLFENQYDAIVTGTYHYRLPPSASVTGFGYWRDGELIELMLQPGEQGGAGGGAGDNDELQEFLGENPFSASIDSLFPGPFQIFFRYVEMLPYDFGEVQMHYPLYTGNFLIDPIDTVSISVSIESVRAMDALTVINFEDYVETSMEDALNADLQFTAHDMTPAEDWTIAIQYSQEDIGAWLYTHRSNLERDGYFMLVIDPGIVDDAEAVVKYFTFVLDRSGSMAGRKIAQARQAVLNCFDHLLPQDHFNIIDFATDVRMYSDDMLAATDNNLDDARDYVGRIRPEGGTNIDEALLEAVGQEMGDNAANQVIFTTDGQPTVGIRNAETIRRRVEDANVNNARIFSFGIGQDVNVPLLTGLADDNHGTSIIFDPNEQNIDEVIDEFYQYFARPALINPVVEINEQIEVDSLYPLEFQDVASGKQLYLYGRYDSFGNVDIELSGTMAEGDTIYTFDEMEFPEADSSNGFVPRMWAKAVIDYWLNWMRINGEDQDVIDRIIHLSIEYGILTPYTEYEDPDDPGDGVDELVIVSFNSSETKGGLALNWVVTGITSSVSYNVYRSYSANGSFKRVNDKPLHSSFYLDSDVQANAILYYRIEMMSEGESKMSQTFMVGQMPDQLTLEVPFPNPFNERTLINFSLTEATTVTLILFDLQGRAVHTIIDQDMSAGAHKVILNSTNLQLANGTYLLQLSADDMKVTQKVVLLK